LGFLRLLVFHICSLKEDAKELGFLRLLVFHIGSLNEDAKELLLSRVCAADGGVLSNLHSKKIAIRVGFLRLISSLEGFQICFLTCSKKICKELVSGDCAERDFQICSLKRL
jgi:hypothetical protein